MPAGGQRLVFRIGGDGFGRQADRAQKEAWHVIAKPDDARFAVVVAARPPRRFSVRLPVRFFRTRLRLASGFALSRRNLRTVGVDAFAAARFPRRRLVVRTAATDAFSAAARLALGRFAMGTDAATAIAAAATAAAAAMLARRFRGCRSKGTERL